LHDPVRRELDPGIERYDVTADDQSGSAPAEVTYLVEELVELMQPGLWPPGGFGLDIFAQHAEQAAHLGQCRAGRVADGCQPPGTFGRQPGRRRPGRLGLHGDHRDVVRHDIMKFASDPGALAAGRVFHN
jgi:hypothetical protein